MKTLSAEQLHELESKGYLLTVHAVLISLFQINLLVRRHNEDEGKKSVIQVKLEVARDIPGADAGL